VSAVTGQTEEQVSAASTAGPGRSRRRKRASRGDGRLALYLVSPTIVLLLVVIGYPVISAIYHSVLLDKADAKIDPTTGLFQTGGKFVGGKYYSYWLHCGKTCPNGTTGHEFWPALQNTVLITVASVVLEVIIGTMMALVMHRAFKGRALIRASILVPWAIPTAVTARMWEYMLQPDGVINKVFHVHIIWLGREWPAKFAIIIADVWKTTPFIALLLLAGLQIIPEELYESVKVDGANAWQRFTNITLPLVKPALLVAVLFRTLDVLRIFDLPFLLTHGANNTHTLSTLTVFELRSSPASASALSTITFVFIFLVALVLVRVFSVNVVQTQARSVKA
jgi:multiple sugar transport system permease protein